MASRKYCSAGISLLRVYLGAVTVFILFLSLGILSLGCREDVSVPFRMKICSERSFTLQIFHTPDDRGGFTEACSRYYPVMPGPNDVKLDISAKQIQGLRLDFGSNPGKITFSDGSLGSIPLPEWKHWNYSGDVTSRVDSPSGLVVVSDREDPYIYVTLPVACRGRFCPGRISLACLLLALGFAFYYVVCRLGLWPRYVEFACRPAMLGLNRFELFYILACVVFYLLWIASPLNYGPDETMRFRVTRFLFDNGRLPVGAETIEPYWGTSYAHLPTLLSNVLGACFMKVASLFTNSDRTLLIAARLVSLFSIVGVVYWVIRASRYVFHTPARWLFVVLISALPQSAFISSYVNNDSLALLGGSMIFYVWVSSLREGWSRKRTVLLSVGMAVCATSYYNSYVWILLSMFVFPIAYLANRPRDYAGLVRVGLFISVLTIALAGYFFVRHVCLYGDILGFKTAQSFAVQYAQGIPGGIRQTMLRRGVSLQQMLFDYQWIDTTWKSLVGVFGPMCYFLRGWCYRFYQALAVSGSIGMIFCFLEITAGRVRVSFRMFVLAVSLTAVAVITIGLAIFYSYASDFQPQGRYCFPALIPLALFVAKGCECLLERVVRRSFRVFSVLIAVSGMFMVALCGYTVMRCSY